MNTLDLKNTLSLLQKQTKLLHRMKKDFVGLSIEETIKLERALFEAAQKLESAQVVLWSNGKV